MSNGRTTYEFEDISNSDEVPDSDLGANTGDIYIPTARIASGQVGLERVSLSQLLNYLFEQQNINALTTRVEDNTQNLGSLFARVAALEQGAGTTPAPEHTGQLRFGLRDNTGARIGTEGTITYRALPITLAVTFPAANAQTDSWYLTVPTGAAVQHIWNEGLARTDEIATWVYDNSNRRYTFTGLTPGFTGKYSIALAVQGG